MILLIGSSSWQNKSIVRAIPCQHYEEWRPESYDATKRNYNCGFLDLDNEDDFNFDLPIFEGLSTKSSNIVTSTSNEVTPNQPPTEFHPTGSADVVTIPTPPPGFQLSQKDQILDCFKCGVCMEFNLKLVYCNSCAHNIGCANCIGNLVQCTRCRAKFEIKCSKCGHLDKTLPVPVTITGLEEAFEGLL
eukprot:TCONS_00029484-protein